MVIKNIKNAFKAIPQQFDIKMTERKTIYFFITSSTQTASSYDIQTANYSTGNWSNLNFVIQSQDENVIRIISCKMERNIEKDFCQWSGNVTIEGVFIGRTEIYACVIDASNSIDLNLQELEKCHIPLAKITVTRRQNLLDSAFKGIVAGFVTILYINFGAALDLTIIKRILLKPIGPAIGFMAQFLIMPLLSFIIGYVLFHDRVDLRLGLFFIGSTPGGGGSNLFTVILKANLNLSVAMTTISNLLAFMMMPLWILTLGSVIFKDGNLVVPYKTIVIMSCSLLLPLCIGILFQKCTPKFAKFLTKILRPFAFIMIIIITVFGFLTNTYLFKLFTWKVKFCFTTFLISFVDNYHYNCIKVHKTLFNFRSFLQRVLYLGWDIFLAGF